MPHRALLVPSLAALVLTLGGNAFAQEACGDTTCPKNWECATEPAPCPDLPCDGADCPPCEGTTEACRALPCASDADCDPAMRCVTEQHTVCTGGDEPCGANDGGKPECPEPEPVDCTVETISACVPAYVLPCESAAGCGEGFTCEPVEECSCGGSSGAPADGGGAEPAPRPAPDGGDAFAPADGGAEPPPPDDCTCVPTDTNHCVPVKAACTEATAAADCPSGWTCVDNPEGVCFSGPEGSGCTPADPPMVCAPPFSDLGGGVRGGDDGGETGGGTPVGLPDGGTEPPAAGGAGRSGNGAENDDAMSSERGGCSVTRPSGASSGALAGFVLAALGLVLARRRR
jgi:MYXO-CTERM domain-containing protein